jgi:hypothetical protein
MKVNGQHAHAEQLVVVPNEEEAGWMAGRSVQSAEENYFLFDRQSNELSFIHPVVLSQSWATLDPL